MKKLKYFVVAAGITGLIFTASLAINSESKIHQTNNVQAVYETVQNIETAQQLEDIIAKNEYVAADMSAKWCGPCRRYDPIFEEVSKDYKDKVVFCKSVLDKIDQKEAYKICNDYQVSRIPKTIFFKNGEEVYAQIGLMSKEELIKLIDTKLLDKNQ